MNGLERFGKAVGTGLKWLVLLAIAIQISFAAVYGYRHHNYGMMFVTAAMFMLLILGLLFAKMS